MNRQITLITIFLLLFNFIVSGQGCSDAGACSFELPDLKTSDTAQTNHLNLNFTQSFALGEKFIFISQSVLDIQYRISTSTNAQLSIPFVFTYGNLGYTYGPGDMILTLSQSFFNKKNFRLTAILGSRIKVNNAAFSFDGQPLPMAYQTSLGTYDIITGLQYARAKWNFYMAYQHPFGRNENGYLIPEGETNADKQYFESAYLKRGDDLYARLRYYHNLRSGTSLTFTLLAIYRLQKSEIIKNDRNTILEGSDGLTLNPGITFSKVLKKSRKLSFQLAFPVIDRDYRADGLTRNAVISVRISNL